MTEFVSCGLRCHEEWVAIPTEPGADITAWVDEQAKELVERSAADGKLLDEDLLRQDLRERAADSRGRKRVHAFALYVNGLEESTALLEVDFIHPDETVAAITLDWIAERFSTDDFGAPEITHARVPLGDAVRIRQNFAAGDSGPDSERVLMETITYGVVPPGSDSAVIMLVSWTYPGVSDIVERMADDIVGTLTVETEA